MRKKYTKILVAITIAILCMTVPCFAFSPSDQRLYNGIDVSAWQGNINFAAVKADGIEVVYIKSSEGQRFVDPFFRQNYENAKANNLKVGFYHYVTARSVEAAKLEARHFVNTVSGTNPDCMLAMDFEAFGNLSVNEINRIALTFMQEVETLSGKKACVYSNLSTARNIFSSELAKYPLWIAQYGVDEPGSPGKWDSWVGYQYTDVGRVSGISGNVDRDYYTKDIFLSDSSSNIPKPDPNPNPNPTKEYITYRIVYGDTLSGIAYRYNSTVRLLAQINKIKNPNLIYAGDTLLIPSDGSYAGNPEGSICNHDIYTIVYGDTLSEIAVRFGTTVSRLAKLNNIVNPNLIYAGDKLIICKD